MRVIAGSRRSLPLKAPKTNETRPTTDRIKETLFNILSPLLPGSRFLDLFSGSGGIGIEALSRGAERAVFVEKGREAADVIRQNLVFTKFTGESLLLPTDALSAIGILEERGERFSLVFMDPPYGSGMDLAVLKRLQGSRVIDENTLLILETALEADPDDYTALGYELVRDKTYKTNRHLFLNRISTAANHNEA